MYLNRLKIRNFRNCGAASLCFDEGVNYIIGDNAQGKSNLIEAIYYLSTGRSFRTNRVGNLIKWGLPAFKLKADVVDDESTFSIDVSYHCDRASLILDGRRARRMGDLVGLLNTIIFCPEDIYIVKGSPYIRRRFIDIHISQLYPVYLRVLVRYGRVLRQRNEAIRRGGRELAHWDKQLVECGLEIMRRRALYIDRLCEMAREAYSRIRPDETLLLTYRSLYSALGGKKDGSAYHEALRSSRSVEKRRGTTLIGPHRDDIVIDINGRDVRYFASDGQRRSVIIALKFAQFTLVREVLGKVPLLLIDDPLAELDTERRRAVMPFFSGDVQCIITAMDEEGPLPGKRFRVKAGEIKEVG